MEITMEQMEQRMEEIMIKVNEPAADSIGKALVFADDEAEEEEVNRKQLGEEEEDDDDDDEAEEEEEKEEELDDTTDPAMKDGGDSNGILPAAAWARALRMDLASCYIPDHDEDAHFVHPEAGFAGVADGVGGCRDKGVDAAAFARALMKNALAGAKAKRGRHNSKPVDPSKLLQRAYMKAAAEDTPGASTAVIVSLHGTTLSWAYVGDSALAVFRGGKMVHRSTPQQHDFNCPYQLSSTGGDSVADAIAGEMALMEGDVVVVATDGLFDNVFDVELEQVVRKGVELGFSPQTMADRIAAVASKMSRSWWTPSPFTVEMARAAEDGREPFSGGKVDDITVVVAYIVPMDS